MLLLIFRSLLVLALALTAGLAAQTSPEVEISAEPHHHLVFENASVRIFNLEVPPHAETLMHWHRHDYVFVTLGNSRVANEVKGKAPVEVTLPDGDTRFLPAPFAHLGRNLSDGPFRNVTVELLQDEKLRSNSAAKWDEERGLDVLEGGTKQILFVKDGVRVSEIELRPGGVVPANRHAGPYLVVAVTDLDLRCDVPGKRPVQGHLKAGESEWVSRRDSQTLTNTGTGPAKFVTLEFP